jgi:hypothetical protein
VGDRDVFVLTNTFPDRTTAEWRRFYLFDDGTRIDRLEHEVYIDETTMFKKRQYVPGFLRFDRSRTEPGTEWDETVTRYETNMDGINLSPVNITYSYKVDSNTATATLKDGTKIENCIQITRVNQSDFETKVYTFAPGIGKVQEETLGGTSEEKTELLMAVPAFAK